MTNELYHEALLDLAKDKSRSGRLDPHDGSARADNPLCGDRVTIDLCMQNGMISEIRQKTRGCILTQAAAAMIGRHAVGLRATEVLEFSNLAKHYLNGDNDKGIWPEFAYFEPVREIISRHDCVMIAFKALEDATADAATMGATRS